ncbi:MAG: ABC transporter ATP-binding protein [Armatimonadota bacterium]|nr:ABC transporter ATP-binding protein [Armatimonadota bacterium]
MIPAGRGFQVEIAGVVCRLGTTVALDGVSLVIPTGTVCGVVGPNGAGKTTLLRALAGMLRPDAGVVMVARREPAETPAAELARFVAMLPQRPVAPAGMTVREAVAWGRGPHVGRLANPGPDDLRAIDEALEHTQTAHLAARSLDALSGGELHRIFIARVLAQSPRILLLDEPTAHLDLTHQVAVMALLRRQAARGVTVVAALHDVNLAATYCDRLALLSRGRLLAFGEPSAVVRADTIAEAYGPGASIRRNPATGRPYVTAAPPVTGSVGGPRVHVIAGGGAGSEVIARCVEIGCRVTVGVVHVMDTDDETARALGLEVIEEAPFVPVGEEAVASATTAARAADAVIVAPVPFGPGNLRNLEVAAGALRHGVPVIVIGDLAGRDFTNGIAARRVADLVAAGARPVADTGAAIEALRRTVAVRA